MADLFANILTMSLSALWLVPLVIALRLILKRSPKWVHVLLWAMVAFRLVCPLSLESSLSLLPDTRAVVEEWADDYVGDTHFIHDISPDYQTAVDAGREPVYAGEDGYYVVTGSDKQSAPDTVENTVLPKLALLWLAGMAVMAFYTAFSYLHLLRMVSDAVRYQKNIYRSSAVASPFVLGLFRPRIYLPATMAEADVPHVIAHERAHIRRKDHWWKPLGFGILTVHWFNPLVWLAYILLCRDIELACDEKVIRELGNAQKADYSQALLNCSIRHRTIAACPLAFGEVGVKQRVKSILNYRKPGFWVILAALVLCLGVAVFFLTDPAAVQAPFGQDWYIDYFLYLSTFREEPQPDVDWNYQITTDSYNTMLYAHYRLTEEGELSVMESDTGKWATLGTLEEEHLSMLNFDEYFKEEANWYTDLYRPEKFRETYVRAWRLDVNPEGYPGLFYLLLEMEDGKFYLMCGYAENTSHAAQEASSAMYWVARLTGADPASATAIRWFDYLETGGYPDGSADFQAQLPQYPDVTFKCTPGELTAETETGSTMLITGMPIWNVFLSDLTGDGIDDFCATVSYGSGIIDQHVVVYDYAAREEYTLWERGVFDYTLRLEDRVLVCDKRFYPHGDIADSGRLMLVSAGGGSGRKLTMDPEDEKPEEGTVSFRDVDFSNVDAILLTNARNGKSTAIADPNAIEDICSLLSAISGRKERSSKGNHHQGTFVLTLMEGEKQAVQITFGDEDVFFYGTYDEKFSKMYDLVDYNIESVIHHLYRYDESGYDWGYEETWVTAEVTPYDTTSTLPYGDLQGDIEYLQPGDIIGYGFLKEELQDLGILLKDLMREDFVEPQDFTPTMKVNLRWEGGRLTLYSDGRQTTFGEDQSWAVRSGELNKFLSRFSQERLAGGEQLPLEELSPYYNSEQAMIDGCVVMKDGDAQSGQELFDKFYESVLDGTPGSIRVADFSSEERFAIQVSDILYDGEDFTWQAVTDGQLYERHYRYLYHFSGEPESPNASYDAYDAYVLTDEKNITWEKLWGSLYSSSKLAPFDFTLVYVDYVYYPDHPVIPDCSKITLELENEILLTAKDMDAVEALFAQAEETYEPKTWSPGPILRLTGKDGTEVIVELGLDTDWVRIDGIYYDFGPGFDEDGAYDALTYLFSLLGIRDWPQEVYDGVEARRSAPDSTDLLAKYGSLIAENFTAGYVLYSDGTSAELRTEDLPAIRFAMMEAEVSDGLSFPTDENGILEEGMDHKIALTRADGETMVLYCWEEDFTCLLDSGQMLYLVGNPNLLEAVAAAVENIK